MNDLASGRPENQTKVARLHVWCLHHYSACMPTVKAVFSYACCITKTQNNLSFEAKYFNDIIITIIMFSGATLCVSFYWDRLWPMFRIVLVDVTAGR